MHDLYQKAIDHLRVSQDLACVVRPSIPILYFGDLKQYENSKPKVVTVGLNPSNAEFPCSYVNAPCENRRFAMQDGSRCTPEELEQVLCDYFKQNPYTAWFDRLEKLLQHLGVSFYEERPDPKPRWWNWKKNRALHTDICTPLATHPTWSGLRDRCRERLLPKGYELWRALIEVLEPDLILMSVAEQHRDRLKLKWRPPVNPIPGGKRRHELHFAMLGRSNVVWARSQVRPFFHVKDEHLHLVAGIILTETGIELSSQEA